MEYWLITSRAEVMPLDFDGIAPDEICLPDVPLMEMLERAEDEPIQASVYLTYTRFDIPEESGRIGSVYSMEPPTVQEIQLIAAYRSGLESALPPRKRAS